MSLEQNLWTFSIQTCWTFVRWTKITNIFFFFVRFFVVVLVFGAKTVGCLRMWGRSKSSRTHATKKKKKSNRKKSCSSKRVTITIEWRDGGMWPTARGHRTSCLYVYYFSHLHNNSNEKKKNHKDIVRNRSIFSLLTKIDVAIAKE